MRETIKFCTFICVISVSTWLWAGNLPQNILMSELMMEAQGADALTLARLYGPDASSPLQYASNVDVSGQSLSYSTVPGSKYHGQPITLSGTVSYDSGTGSYLFDSTGTLGTSQWSSAGSFVGDPTLTVFIGPLDMEFGIDWVTYPDETDSVVSVGFTILGIKVASGNAYDVLDTNGLTIGQWNWVFDAANVNNHSFKVKVDGFTPLPDGGAGSFTQSILPTPEPTSLLLVGSGVLGLSGFFRKRLLNQS